ncbi:hypothetical protein AB0H82_24145 [Streptomyces sp. NPDC050732]|uniref:hypothetical protein n=1 Tax=Streptomyces sp. NPDC050732 TaxID=3154632 RepID=UPI003449E41D
MSEHRGSGEKNAWRGPLLCFVEIAAAVFVMNWFFSDDRDPLPTAIMWSCVAGAAASILFPGLARLYKAWRKRF